MRIYKDVMEEKSPNNNLNQNVPSHQERKVIRVGWRSLWRKKIVHWSLMAQLIYYNANTFTEIQNFQI